MTEIIESFPFIRTFCINQIKRDKDDRDLGIIILFHFLRKTLNILLFGIFNEMVTIDVHAKIHIRLEFYQSTKIYLCNYNNYRLFKFLL